MTARFKLPALLLASLGLIACGAPVTQTPACAEYVACVAAIDSQTGRSTDVDRYLEGGVCWGIEAGATLCDRSCDSGLAFLRDRQPNLPEACE